ncbi:hypothetical protein BPADB04_48440 [Bacillus paranthracis]|uniref:hypothetical protein n=1 Tax=Bacillus paranthracis TaxID=2026186 RepID=UPI001C7E2915|nr:hypothetical protein [Bacillus paranthracis]GIX59814.1 hypothetical protein BPADB04_48440 [Bacillus paranthracis]
MTNHIGDIVNEVNMSCDPKSCVTFVKGTVKPEWYEALKKEYPYESETHVKDVNDYMNGTEGVYVITLTKTPHHSFVEPLQKHENLWVLEPEVNSFEITINLVFWMVGIIFATGISYLTVKCLGLF